MAPRRLCVRTIAATLFLAIFSICGISSVVGDDDDKTKYEYGLIKLVGKEDIPPICMVYPNEYYSLNTVAQKAYNLSYEKTLDLCQPGLTEDDFTPKKQNSLILLSTSTNCSISPYYKLIQEGNSSGLILLSNFTALLNESHGWEVYAIVQDKNIPIFLNATKPGDETQVEVTKLASTRFDPSLVVLWLLAVLCVGIGSYTGPYRLRSDGADQDRETLGEPQGRKESQEEAAVYTGITITAALGLVVFISATLLLLYFFYQYLVYFFIFVFCCASPRALYILIIQFVNYILPGVHFPKIWKFEIHEIFFALICITFPIVWFIFRFESWAWGIQDLLGVSFCINLIQMLHLPNMKIITIILVLLFVYDVFFVFITPFFTSNGRSVMVEVATGVSGSGSSEQLPMLLQFPRLLNSPRRMCTGALEFSLLGYGDIIVPGFLVCFAHGFDLRKKKEGGRGRPYFITSLIAYSVGLGGAFVALLLSSSGQPALFYIVPSVLIAIFTLGLIKRDVNALWSGDSGIQSIEVPESETP